MDRKKEKQMAARKATEFIQDGMVVGLGTGSTAEWAIKGVGNLIKEGYAIHGIATSLATEALAIQYGIPLLALDQVEKIDLTIDGADEFDPYMQLIKGGGGALLKEKIIAFQSEQNIIIADSSKQVERLGAFPLPVEVIPFALAPLLRLLTNEGMDPQLRHHNKTPFETEAGNFILDVDISRAVNLTRLEDELKHVPGVVETGLFLDTTDIIIVGKQDGVEVIQRP